MHKLLALTIQQPGGAPVVIGPQNTSLPTGGLTTLQGTITNALTLFIIAAVVITLIIIAYSGLQWVSSGGDKQKVSQARARLTWGIVGLVIVFTAFLVVRIVASFFNITLF